jgi:hypothetical protein
MRRWTVRGAARRTYSNVTSSKYNGGNRVVSEGQQKPLQRTEGDDRAYNS